MSYPERLYVSELVPKMVNGVLLAQCVRVGRRERVEEEDQMDSCDSFMIQVQDSTGEGGLGQCIVCTVVLLWMISGLLTVFHSFRICECRC